MPSGEDIVLRFAIASAINIAITMPIFYKRWILRQSAWLMAIWAALVGLTIALCLFAPDFNPPGPTIATTVSAALVGAASGYFWHGVLREMYPLGQDERR
jgi:hypothetical protein